MHHKQIRYAHNEQMKSSAYSQIGSSILLLERQQYRLFTQNKPSSMTRERIELLEDVNFQWKLLEDWIDRFRELEEYATRNGDTLVPQHYFLNPSLGIWVRNQRTQFKLFKEGKQSKLSLERIKMLESLNFEWNAYNAKWMASYVGLGKYMRQHGLGRLPSYYENRSLRNWSEEQRKQYRNLHEFDPGSGEGAASRLSQERIELLELLAFPWAAKDSTDKDAVHSVGCVLQDQSDYSSSTHVLSQVH